MVKSFSTKRSKWLCELWSSVCLNLHLNLCREKEVETEYECFERVFPRSLLDSSQGSKYSRKVRPEMLQDIRERETTERYLAKAVVTSSRDYDNLINARSLFQEQKKTIEIIPISKICCLTAEDRQISYIFWLVGRKPYLYHVEN